MVHNGWFLYSSAPSNKNNIEDHSLINEYQKQVKEVLNNQIKTNFINQEKAKKVDVIVKPLCQGRALSLIYENLNKFDPYSIGDQSNEGKIFNTKLEIYRIATIFIDNLALYYGKTNGTTYEKIDYLVKAKEGPQLFNEKAAKNLKKAVAIANELRLKTYLTNKGQKERMHAGYKYEYKMKKIRGYGNKAKETSKELEKELMKEVFFIKEEELKSKTSKLFEFYYVMFPLREFIKKFSRRVSGKEERVKIVETELYEDNKLHEGMVYKRIMKYKEAKESLEKYVKEKKEDSYALHLLGSVLNSLGEYNEAKEHYEKSLKITKKVYGTEEHAEVAMGYNNLGLLLRDQGKFEEAKKNFEKSLKITKKVYGTEEHASVAMGYNNLGTVLNDQGKYEEAKKNYGKSLKINKKVYGTEEHASVAMGYNNLGIVLNDQGKYEEAKKNYGKSLKIKKKVYGTEEHADVAAGYNNLGLVLRAQGKYEEAKKNYEKSLKIKKKVYGTEEHADVAMGYNNLGTVLRDQGKYEEAFIYFQKAYNIYKIKLRPSHPYIKIVNTNISITKRLLDISKELHKHPNNIDLQIQFGLLILAAGNKKKALSVIAGVLQKKPNNAKAHLAYARILEKSNQIKQAQEHYKLAIRHSPKDFNILSEYSSFLIRIKQYEQAILQLKKLLEISPKNEEILNILRQLYQILGKTDDLIWLYQYLIKLNSKNTSAYKSLAEMYLFYKSNAKEAIKYYEKVLKINPEDNTVYHNLACMYVVTGKIRKAEEHFQKGIKVNLTSSICTEYALFLSQRQNKEKEIISACLNAIKLKADKSGLSYGKLEKEVVGQELKREIEQFGNITLASYILAYRLLISAYIKTKRNTEASEALKQFKIEIEKQKNPLYFSLLGYAYLELKMYKKAALAFQKAIELKPDYELAKENLELVKATMLNLK